MLLCKSQLASQCCMWTSSPVTLYICHALFYKVNKLGFREESAVSERDAVVPGGL